MYLGQQDPQPPYPVPVPDRYADTPFADLPIGLRVRIRTAMETTSVPALTKAT